MKNYLEPAFIQNFVQAYNDIYALHPNVEEEDFRFRYLRVDWFFPNHIHNVLSEIKRIGSDNYKDEVNFQISLYAGLFHDAGLVYKRDSADPVGHEGRSVEYAREELLELGYETSFIEQVAECIKSTEPEHLPTSPEAELVRNADAYAHIISMHFFGKANFTKDIHKFITWFEEKIETTHIKISIPTLRNEVSPLVEKYRMMIHNYRQNRSGTDFVQSLLL